MKGALLVCGTSSDAGKSTVVAALCRALARRGIRVAPFKAQNMSLNSTVSADGFEIARAQAMQAQAAGVEPTVEMNPLLLKPEGERKSQLVVMGRPVGHLGVERYREAKAGLAAVVAKAYRTLRERYDVVICEGAGGAAEINLRKGDLANLGFAQAHRLPVVLVCDIERGGAFASLYGTFALLSAADQRLVAGFLLNRFRGERTLLESGIRALEGRTGRPLFGVLPYRDGLNLDAEDSQALGRSDHEERREATVEVAVLRLALISNFTDFDPLFLEPSLRVRFTRSALDLRRADLVLIPGTKATVKELALLRAEGLDRVLGERAREGGPIFGICGGYQLLGERIVDRVESGLGAVEGLGLLPVRTVFAPEKVLRRVGGRCPWLDSPVVGYEVHHGIPERRGGQPLFESAEGAPEGTRCGVVCGTSWHGIFEADSFRHAFFAWLAQQRGVPFTPAPTPFALQRERRFEALRELLEQHADLPALERLIEAGVEAIGEGRPLGVVR